ncbi:hemolysin III family protein [Clostridium sp. SYSU_GA19001]|uniref:PAQR family membrane homeostasis protein TrhA n=1 Tax=Clostridium caldaquaticum TaxID=2940653 RepID=UPI002077728B|nr:hemolysin III family protein [Clostridium caldaquaticum]MCM8709622.1 hemolysin III family protein [Clostridium caldaquaticum]
MEGKFYTKGEEIANAVTHGVGTLLAIAALVLLIVFAAIEGTAWHVVSFSIFGSTLVILYLESTLYHSLTNKKAKRLFRKFDHMSIYLLIAGTYTPFCLTVLRGTLGWTIFGIIWASTVVGIVLKAFYTGKKDVLSTVLYIVMGWMVIIAIRTLYIKMTFSGFLFLVIGGVLYTVGTLFYVKDKIAFNHGIWHLFVIGGSVFHFFSVMSLLNIK